MMLDRCQDVVEVLSDRLDNTLDPVHESALDSHLQGCDGCSTYLQQLRSTVVALRGLGTAPAR